MAISSSRGAGLCPVASLDVVRCPQDSRRAEAKLPCPVAGATP